MLPNTEPTGQTDKDGSAAPSITDPTPGISQRFHSHELLPALQAMRIGDFSVRISGDWIGIEGKIVDTFNEIAAANERMAQQLERVGKEGETKQRVRFEPSSGARGEMESSINAMVDQLNAFASEVTRIAREVDHRAKNALAVVQSIVRLTRANTIEEFTSAVEGRIRSLSLAHTILSLSRWQGADLSGLVEEELAPYRTDGAPKVTASGPTYRYGPQRRSFSLLRCMNL